MKVHRSTAGVTLLELVFVVAIIGIIAATAVPRFGANTISGKQVEATSKAIVSDLRLVRQMAISNNTDHYLYINNVGKEYGLYASSVTLVNRIGAAYPFSDSVSITGDNTFGFEPNGNIVLGSGNTAVLTDGANEWTITVTSATGSVRAEKTN